VQHLEMMSVHGLRIQVPYPEKTGDESTSGFDHRSTLPAR
jgi:hypothetical protein